MRQASTPPDCLVVTDEENRTPADCHLVIDIAGSTSFEGMLLVFVLVITTIN